MDKNPEFVLRFIEACGSAQPAKIQRLLNISYQTAKNYLDGRLPKSEMLVSISQRTSYSIDWLLTGHGKKFVDTLRIENTPLATGQFEALVRQICMEVINENYGRQEVSQPKVVVLQSSELMSEKVMDEARALTGSQP